jgi:hypothetical protein
MNPTILRVGRTVRVVCCAAAALVAAAAAADTPDGAGRAADARVVEGKPHVSRLLGKLPPEFTVQAVGTYAGTAELADVRLDGSGHAVRQAEVIVNRPHESVVLVLTAYDPVVWRVGRTPGTHIAGVVVSGYHGQALIGVRKDTPHAIATHETKGAFPYFLAHAASPRLLRMNEAVNALIGREIDRFVNKPVEGTFYVGEPPKDPGEVVYSDELTLKDYVDPGRPPAGADGLEQLVKEGKLRPATQKDIDAWAQAASEQYKRFSPDLRVETRMAPQNTYVVLKELTLPDGLYGGHAKSFILGEAIPFPAGPAGHNRFFRTDGTEEGPMAGHAE